MNDKLKSLWQRSVMGRALLVAPPVAIIAVGLYMTVGTRQAIQYYTAKVDRGEVAQVVQATGTINAVTSVQVGSQVSGNIEKLSADFNSVVKKGQVVAQIDPAVFRAQMQQAEADLANAQANVKALEAQVETQKSNATAALANVAKAQASLNDAKLNLDRNTELAKEGIVASQVRDSAQAAYDGALASLHAAEAQYAQAQSGIKSTMAQADQARAQVLQRRASAQMARVNLEHCTIYAPIDGTVIARNVDVGQTVAASFSAPVLFVIAQDLTKMLVYAKTDESDVGKIKEDAPATFRVDSFPRETFHGRVKQVRKNAATIQNVVTYDTIIEFDNPEQRLFPGMTAYVSIPVDWVTDAVKIPNGALRFKPELTDEERKALYAKYGIPEDRAAGRLAGMGMRGGQGGSGGQGGNGGQAGQAGQGGGGQAAQGGAQGGGPATPGAAGAGGGGGRRAGGGNGGAGGTSGGGTMRGSSTRDDWGIVWKLLPDKTLKPIRVKLGVTDFTFTACMSCYAGKDAPDIKPGDELLIGQTSKNPSQQAQGSQQRPPGMGGPGGGPGGPGQMRRF
jgi:HlyD family secretion protein